MRVRPRYALVLALLAASSGCPRTAAQGPDLAELSPLPSEGIRTTVEGLIAHSVAPLPHGQGVVVLGEIRVADDDYRAWVGRFAANGELLWSDRIGMSFIQGTALLVDPYEGVHVITHDAGGYSQLLGYGPDGRRRSLLHLGGGEIVGFHLRGDFVHVFNNVAAGNGFLANWHAIEWTREFFPAEARLIQLEDVVRERPPTLTALDADTLLVEQHTPRAGGVQSLSRVVMSKSCEPVPQDRWQGSWVGLFATQRALADRADSYRAVSYNLEAREPTRISLANAREMLVVQLRGDGERQPRLVVEGPRVTDQAAEQSDIEALLAEPDQLPAWGDQDWPSWDWRWQQQLYTPAELAGEARYVSWLHGERCPSRSVTLWSQASTALSRRPRRVLSSDPCWMQLQLEALLPQLDGAAFARDLDAWLELLTRSYANTAETDIDPETELREQIIQAALRAGAQVSLISTLFAADDQRALVNAVELLSTLPTDEGQRALLAALAELRNDPSRCADVRIIVEGFERLGTPAPLWSSDRRDPCDMLYVLCTGLEPELHETGVDPDGILHTFECDIDDTWADDCDSTVHTSSVDLITPAMVESCMDYEADEYADVYDYSYYFEFDSHDGKLVLTDIHEDLLYIEADEEEDEDWNEDEDWDE